MFVELDAMPGGYVCSASMKARLAGDTEVRKVTRGKRSPRKLFSKAQRAFYAEHAPEGLGIDDLTLLGPIFVLKAKSFPRGFNQKMVTELWLYPDGSRILELSTKCPPKEMFQVAAEARAYLTGTRDRPLGRAADEDEVGAGAVLTAPPRRRLRPRADAVDGRLFHGVSEAVERSSRSA